jgi:hypothetical protein
MKTDKLFRDWTYRQLFVKIEKESKSLTAVVTNDGWFVDNFQVQSDSEEYFYKECEEYLKSKRFQEKLKVQRGY